MKGKRSTRPSSKQRRTTRVPSICLRRQRRQWRHSTRSRALTWERFKAVSSFCRESQLLNDQRTTRPMHLSPRKETVRISQKNILSLLSYIMEDLNDEVANGKKNE